MFFFLNSILLLFPVFVLRSYLKIKDGHVLLVFISIYLSVLFNTSVLHSTLSDTNIATSVFHG